MEKIITHFKATYEHNEEVISLAAIDNPFPYNPFIDGLDLLLLVVTKRNTPLRGLEEHIAIQGERVQIRTVSPAILEQWIVGGKNRNIIQWLVRGEILLDRGNYLTDMRDVLLAFPSSIREQKQLSEFSYFIRTYLRRNKI